MSELYSWLKEKKAEKREDQPESAAVMVEQQAEAKAPGAAGKELAPRAPEESQPAAVEETVPGRFDLEMADWRVKTVLDHRTIVGEQYRFLRSKLQTLQAQKDIKTVLVTSSVPAEGKTFTACCLAGILAQGSGKKVLLLDADLRKPSAAQNFGMNGTGGPRGLTQVLRGEVPLENALLRCSNLDFYFLPAGSVAPDAAELLCSPRLENAVKGMRLMFDWVIIDSPPVLPLADASRLVPLSDTVLLVIWANKTPAGLINQAIQMIGRGTICGAVLNRVPQIKAMHYYSHYATSKPR